MNATGNARQHATHTATQNAIQNANQQFCTFFLNGLTFGVEVEKVQEVIRHQPTTHVPLAPAVLGGLINLRGQIVTALDLRRRLEMPERPPDKAAMNVVISTDDGAISLLVDEIGDVVEVSEGTFEPPPDTLNGVARELIRGAYKLKGRLMLLIDTERSLKFA
jgi:purine-binding chemotaxis protein CheW